MPRGKSDMRTHYQLYMSAHSELGSVTLCREGEGMFNLKVRGMLGVGVLLTPQELQQLVDTAIALLHDADRVRAYDLAESDPTRQHLYPDYTNINILHNPIENK